MQCFGHLIRVGYHEPLFSFVVAHGAFELTGLVIAGMAGMKLGWALIAPGKRTRIEALKHNALIAVKNHVRGVRLTAYRRFC